MMVRVIGSGITFLPELAVYTTAKQGLSGMPRGPKSEKRPADVIGNAVHVMRIATGEIEDSKREPGKGRRAQ
jgi:hypothetical protein